MKRLVIGILAHVDSGKTTLSEGMLYSAGEIRRLGRVDHKSAFLDTHHIEQDRGITIFSKQAVIHLEDMQVTLLDTPGHVDFSAETERTLQVLDYAVLVISGSEGVQSHTETLWNLLARYNIPAFIFVNKMDIAGSDYDMVMRGIKDKFGDGCIDFADTKSELFFEEAAMCGEDLMNSFLEKGKIDEGQLTEAVFKRQIFPCYFGSALKMDGVKEFLGGLKKYTKNLYKDKEFGAKIFKIGEDERGARLTYMKITGGSLKVKETVKYKNNAAEEKVNQIRVYSGAKFQTVEEALPGMVCAVCGLSCSYPGMGLGTEQDAASLLMEPVLTYRVDLPENADIHTALKNFRRIEEEEPQFHIIWNEHLQEIHIQIMGEVQLEVLKQIVRERFDMEADFSDGSILYKETIAAPAEGVGHYEPLRHYAEVHLLLEPGEPGSGLVFASECSEDKLERSWQRLILTHLEEKTHLGVLTGSPITDMKITLIAGRAHKKHTEGGDFRQATYRALRQGLKMAQNVLLEPWYNFKLEIPAENVGRAMTDITRMGGSFSQPLQNGENAVISGSAPVETMRGYHMEVTAYTKGRGRLTCVLKGYEPCHNAEEVIKAIGYNSDADIENTADSIFCSHGAGFLVKWDKVRDFMHIESGFEQEKPQEEADDEIKEHSSYTADDSELMRIFERTYGPVKREIYSAFHTKKEVKQDKKHFKSKICREGPEYLLVDGYNIIFAWENLKELAKESLDMARERLIDILSDYRGIRECELIVVFDAYKVKNNPGTVEKVHNISVVYTKEAETADMYIEKVTHELGKKHRVRVATSDSLEQIIILGSGAMRVSAENFLREVEQAEKEISDFLKNLK